MTASSRPPSPERSPRDGRLWVVYLLAFLGDLSLSLQTVASVFVGNALGASEWEIGIIGGAYGVVYILAPSLIGRLGDRFPRKYSLVVAYAGIAATNLLNAYVVSAPGHLVLTNGLLGFFAGFMWPAIEAHVSENAGDHHARALGNFCLAWSTGYTAGPLLAGPLFAVQARLGFLVLIAVGGIGVALVGGLLPTLPAATPAPGSTPRSTPRSARLVRGNPFLYVAAGALLYSFGKQLMVTIFPDYAVRAGGLALPATLVSLLLFVMGLARTLAFLVVRLRPERDVARTLLWSAGISGLATIFMGVFRAPVALGVVLGVLGWCQGLLYVGALEILLESSSNNKGRYAGIFESGVGVGSVVAPFVGGFLASAAHVLPFLVLGSAFLGACILLGLQGRRHATAAEYTGFTGDTLGGSG